MTGSIQLSPQSRIYSSHGCTGSDSNVSGKGRVQIVKIKMPSRARQRDAWNLHLLGSLRGPLVPVRASCNVLVCRSFLAPGGGNVIPVLKSAVLVLTRSYNAFCANSPVLRLIPAVGILAFAAWGINPLLRLGRSIFRHKSDGSWKKSTVHYFMTAYLQPFLLWAGARLICRALDPLVLPSVASQVVKQRMLNFVLSLSTVLAFAYCLSSLIQLAQKFFVDTNGSSDAKHVGFSFAGNLIYAAVWIAAVVLFVELLRFSTQKWATVGGLGTVLITLAGREIFTNFLSSLMIHATRPFFLNDWIQTKIEGYEVSGTVEHVGWWSQTIIRGDDRETVHIPNHKFTVNVLRNLSQKTHWRIKTHFAISHSDVSKINNIVADMRKVLAENAQVEQQKLHRRVFLENINPENQALMILVSCFVKTSRFEEYLRVKETILLDLLGVLSQHRARLATPIRTVQKIYDEADLENVSFADSIFTDLRAPTNRPALLIEASYKVIDDKVKTPSCAVRTNEEKDAKAEGLLGSESQPDSKPESAPNPDLKQDKITTEPSSKNSSAPVGDPQDRSSVQDNVAQNHSEAQDPSKGMGIPRNLTSVETSPEEAIDEKPSTIANSASDYEMIVKPAALHDKHEVKKSVALSSVPRSRFEENIVLGVALDGSKRTLPIEEETPLESKGLAASRNGSSSLFGATEKKDNIADSSAYFS